MGHSVTTVLIDYSNIRSRQIEVTRTDVELNLDDLIERIVSAVKTDIPTTTFIQARLYGGWIDQVGHFTPSANHLLGLMSKYRGIYSGIRLGLEMILTPACNPHNRIIGFLRTNTKPIRQKMVDELIAVDTVHIADFNDNHIVIASDDDDMVPIVIAACHLSKSRVFLYRHRQDGAALNDVALGSIGASIRKV